MLWWEAHEHVTGQVLHCMTFQVWWITRRNCHNVVELSAGFTPAFVPLRLLLYMTGLAQCLGQRVQSS